MNRLLTILVAIVAFGCQQPQNEITINEKAQDSTLKQTNHVQSRIEHFQTPYFIGDVNNDKQTDTAIVIYDRFVRQDGTIEKACVNNKCEVTITFDSDIPHLTISNALSVSILKTEDLDNDQANEIILFTEWFEGFWGNIEVWSFKSGVWNRIARTQAFLSEPKDWENRIVKQNSKYYLIGDDKWNDSTGNRSLFVEIE